MTTTTCQQHADVSQQNAGCLCSLRDAEDTPGVSLRLLGCSSYPGSHRKSHPISAHGMKCFDTSNAIQNGLESLLPISSTFMPVSMPGHTICRTGAGVKFDCKHVSPSDGLPACNTDLELAQVGLWQV